MAVPRSGGYVLTLLYTNLKKKLNNLVFILAAILIGKNIAKASRSRAEEEKKGGRVAVPRSGGYVLILLYINLKKTKQVCFLLVAILIGKNIAKASRSRAEEEKKVNAPQ